MAIEGTNNTGNENSNQEQGGRKILKAVRRLGNKVVDTGAAVANHPTTGDAARGALGGAAIATIAVASGGLPAMAWLSTQALFVGMSAAAGGSVPVVGTGVKNVAQLGFQGMKAAWDGAKNMFTRAPQAEGNVEHEEESVNDESEDLEDVREQALEAQRTVTFAEGRGSKRSAPAAREENTQKRRATTSQDDAEESHATGLGRRLARNSKK